MNSWEVRPINSYYGKYKDARRVIIEAIQRRDDLDVDGKLALLEQEMNKQRDKFRRERTAEFNSKVESVTQPHSCTVGLTDDDNKKKDCGWKCANSPSPELYTKSEWVSTEGTIKDLQVSDSSACIRMTRAGRGRNAGNVTAHFRYRPDVILRRVESDVESLFNLVSDEGTDAESVKDFIDERGGNHLNSFTSIKADEPDE